MALQDQAMALQDRAMPVDRPVHGDHVVIVGAGHAGGTAAALLRTYGHGGPITMIGAEPIAPYQRPPLSKAWLKGESDADDLALKPVSYYAEHGIDFRAATHVTHLDRAARFVTLGSGERLGYDSLILATGARPILLPIPGGDLSGVLALRTAADAVAVQAAILRGGRLVIIGGGYLGLEVAASARTLGAEVVIVEREPRLLARVACEPLSRFFRAHHEQHGVEFMFSTCVMALQGNRGHVTGAVLSDGRVLPCDAVLVSIGAVPNVELAAAAGLTCENGIVVDLTARTADPAIFAIGDVTRRPAPTYGQQVRLESVHNALEQARQAASAISGRPAPPPEVPWFWSDQYDLKLQIAGLTLDADRTLMRGGPADGKFAVFHLKGDRVQAVEAINAAPEFIMGRQFILSRKAIMPEKLADPAVSMKDVAAPE